MPIHIDTIVTTSKPLDEKIFELLASNPDQFYTAQEIMSALGEFQGFTVLGSKVSPGAMLLGLFADAALADEIGEMRRKKEEQLAMAITALTDANRIQCVNFLGTIRFGVSGALPGWLEQPKVSVEQ
jgi:hypothetical protein